MGAKLRLAEEIVARYHGPEAARAEQEWFVSTFSRKEAPKDAKIIRLSKPTKILDLLREQLPDHSVSEIRRLIRQGGVHLDGAKITNPNEVLSVSGEAVLKVGKLTWFRLVPEP